MEQILIFSDLDGTLVDHDTYDFKEAEPALALLKSLSIPVILCSSKTRAEIEVYQRRMKLGDPFVSENGGAIFLPHQPFNLTGFGVVQKDFYRVIELGLSYDRLCAVWTDIKKRENWPMSGFCEMTIDEIIDHTHLPPEEARLAAKREYSEPFVFSGTAAQFAILQNDVLKRGLKITRGGRFYHLTGRNDKGRAVNILTKIYTNTYPDKRIRTVGLGDSANDLPMLHQVDVPILIRKKTGQWEPAEGMDVIRTDQAGPSGWAESIRKIL